MGAGVRSGAVNSVRATRKLRRRVASPAVNVSSQVAGKPATSVRRSPAARKEKRQKITRKRQRRSGNSPVSEEATTTTTEASRSSRPRLGSATEPTELVRVPAQLPPAPGGCELLRELSAIVINLDRRTDRLARCAESIACRSPWLPYRRFRATDGKNEAISALEVTTSWHTGRNVVFQRLRSQRKGWDDLDSYREQELELSPGERGCADSHIRAWRHCLEECAGGDRPLLVLEDDAVLMPDFTDTLARALQALPEDRHILYLGYSQAADWPREITPELVESLYVWTTVGYILWPAGAKVLLSNLPINQPVDNWMGTLCADGKLRSYCVRPKIIRQAEAWNVGSDVAHSDEPAHGSGDVNHSDEFYWGTSSDILHSDEFYWGSGFDARETDSLGWGRC
eukprot:TRINITY_DN37527_c0_g1_i1.p2 TRINITY_DN37527_c0_g1~~TRINITY_DN37527_c0_g1_i1.p2  ORF type:complete len:398 (-),score=79.36 TRINITY_DN37527_c0_g1_i1:192-1385(-)